MTAADTLPKVRFGSVALVISNLTQSVEWYTHSLGLDVIERGTGDDEHWVVVGRTGLNGGIHLCDIPTFDPKFPVEPGESGLDLKVPGDFHASCAALEANGVRFIVGARKLSWGWEAHIVDPDGNEIRLTPDGQI
jgi:catechol 2,3-dioxygenase-like lactoylglutathione lyase family enzyme